MQTRSNSRQIAAGGGANSRWSRSWTPGPAGLKGEAIQMVKRDHLFVPNKIDYVRGNRPKVDCILCAVIRRDEAVEKLEVFRDDLFCITVNLYPYNPGHLMLVPLRHICDPRELTDQEAMRSHELQSRCMNVLDELYHPHGFNIGYNLGPFGGASLEHLHLHIVPRFRNEIGFMDVISGARTFVGDPLDMVKRISRAFEMSE